MNKHNKIILEDIFAKSASTDLSQDKMMLYLKGKLSATEQHDIELWLDEQSMEADAIEGLKTIETNEAQTTINKLNKRLKKSLRKTKRGRRTINADKFNLIAIATVLLLIILAYIVIKFAIHK